MQPYPLCFPQLILLLYILHSRLCFIAHIILYEYHFDNNSYLHELLKEEKTKKIMVLKTKQSPTVATAQSRIKQPLCSSYLYEPVDTKSRSYSFLLVMHNIDYCQTGKGYFSLFLSS